MQKIVDELNEIINLPILNERQEGELIRFLLTLVLSLLKRLGITV
ncbi:MAG: hypothetical protein PHI68_00105 [Candidatus Cloacimonetes bacterium]|nr:hypothetical protein [Candidatus Cloacimonadota bacterium]